MRSEARALFSVAGIATAWIAIGAFGGTAYAQESVEALMQRCSIAQGLSSDELNACVASLRAIVPVSNIPGVDDLLRVLADAATAMDNQPSRNRHGTADEPVDQDSTDAAPADTTSQTASPPKATP